MIQYQNYFQAKITIRKHNVKNNATNTLNEWPCEIPKWFYKRKLIAKW